MTYRLLNHWRTGEIYDISQLEKSIKWGGNVREASRKLELDLVSGRDYYLPKYQVPQGSAITLDNGVWEMFRGVVFGKSKDTGSNYGITVYDHAVYLLKSKYTYKFTGMTATAIIKRLCSEFGITAGDIVETGITLGKLILREKTIYDMMIIALTETTKRNGKKYQIRMKQGKLNVVERGWQTQRWVITEGQNLISASYSENISDMRNRIIIVGDKDQILTTVSDEALIQQYGLLQELKKEGNIKTGEAQTMAANMLKDLGRISREASIECLGLDDVEHGSSIEVVESLTGLTGKFYVDTDDHTVQNDNHTMSLKLAWDVTVAEQDAGEVEE